MQHTSVITPNLKVFFIFPPIHFSNVRCGVLGGTTPSCWIGPRTTDFHLPLTAGGDHQGSALKYLTRERRPLYRLKVTFRKQLQSPVLAELRRYFVMPTACRK